MTIYKPHYACFECGNLTADMGLDFESPKKGDEKSWEHLRNLFTVGITFHSCGCSGPGYIPRTSEELLEYLTKQRLKYVRNLRFWLSQKEAVTKKEITEHNKETAFYSSQIPYHVKTGKGYANSKNAVDYWNEKLAELEKNIQYVRQTSAS